MYSSGKLPRSPRQPTWLRWLQQTKRNRKEVSLTEAEKRASLLRQQYITLIDPKRKAQLRWLEQWDMDSLFADNVDLGNVQSALSIPLVDLAVSPGLHISLSMSYTSGDVSSNGLLGNGWNVHNVGQDFIVVDHKQSSFPHNHQYQLSIDGNLVNLVPSKDSEGLFTIDNEPDVKVTFMKSDNRWIIDTPNMQTVYGSSDNPSMVPDALHWSLHWPHWRGPGREDAESSLEPEVISWYMISREEKHGLKNKLYYRYLTETRTTSVANKPFTSVIQLESIYDSEQSATMTLIYDTKERAEYPEKMYKDTQGNIQFPVHLLAKHYLLGYHLETEDYQQQLQFGYETTPSSGGSRMMTSVYQIFNENGGRTGETEQVFNMKYEQVAPGKYLLSQLEIPSYHSSLHYSYSQLQIPLLQFTRDSLNTHRIPATGNVQITQGDDYGTMAYDLELGLGNINVRVFNRQLTRFVAELDTGSGRQGNIKRFATLLYPNLIAVLEETEEEKRLHMFNRNRETKEWPRNPRTTITLKKEAAFRYNDKFMVISKNEEGLLGQLMVIRPEGNEDEEEEDRTEEGFKIETLRLTNGANYRVDRLLVQDGIILAYNGYRLHGWKENEKDGNWEESIILELHSEEEEFFQRFEIEKKNVDQLREQMNITGLHMSDNMILMSAVKWNDGGAPEMATNAHLILVDDELRAVKSETHQVKRERILDLEKMEEQPDKTKMWFRYKNDSGKNKLLVYLHWLDGTDFEDRCKDWDGDKEECRKELLKMYNEDAGFQQKMQELIIFDYEPMITFKLEPTGASTKESKFLMTGNGWKSGDLSDSGLIKLGTGYVLETLENRNDSETSYSLYRQNPENGGKTGSKIDEWIIHNEQSGMAVGYPSYLGMQPDITHEPILYPFREEGEDLEGIPLGIRGEQLLKMSNHEMLFTIFNSTNSPDPTFEKEVIVRRVNSVVPSSPLWALTKSEVRHGRESRVRRYETEFNHNDNQFSQENVIRVIPAETREYSGYYEEITVVPIEAPENATKSQNWYDVSGELIRTKDVESSLEEQRQKKEEDEEAKRSHTIYDFSGQLEIADISPFNKTDETVTYFGFEHYENNTIPLSYPEGSLVTNEVPFTGKSMLRLSEGQTLRGSLKPNDQQSTYVATSWIRLPPENTPPFEFESPLEYFKCHLSTHTGYHLLGLYGQMKRQLRDWLYVEVIIDLDKVRNNVYTEIYRYSDSSLNLPPPSSTNFTIAFEMDPGSSEWLDVDHLRFAPINFDFNVNIFDSRTGQETEQLLAGGGVLRKIFNDYGLEISSVDETGSVEQFKSTSRSGFIFPPPSSDSQLGIQEIRREVVVIPEEGVFEMFDDHSLREIWTIDDHTDPESWSITRSRLEHKSDESHKILIKSPSQLFDSTSSALSFHAHFSSVVSSLSVSLSGLPNLLHLQGNGTLNIASGCRIIRNLPSAGELLLHLTEQTLWVWFDGVLLFDRKLDRSCLPTGTIPGERPWSRFHFQVEGPLTISNVFTLSQPQISMEYFNAWGERTQIVQLEDTHTALVSETIYDEMGRDAIKTKATRISRGADYTPLLNYYTDFVKNRYPNDTNSIFRIGTVEGLASDLNPQDEGYPYSRTLYQEDMLREVRVEGMPGKVFSTFGTFNKQHGRHSRLPFLQILFPYRLGFREKVTYEPNGNIEVSVHDAKENEVATYVKVSGFDNILTIYEFDEENRLVKMLPPKYHQQMRTFLRTTPWNFGDDKLTPEEKYWQAEYGTHYQYDELGQLIQKKAPDHRTKGFLYDTMGNMRFMYTVSPENSKLSREMQQAEDVVYMLHSGQNKPVEVGYFKEPVNVGTLMSFQNGTSIPSTSESQIHQRIVYSETHSDPEIRGKVRLFLTYDDHHNEDPTRSGGQSPPHQELLKFNSANHVIMKTSNAVHTDSFTNYQKHYKGGKLREMSYPRGRYSRTGQANETVFNLIQGHDKMGRVTRLGTRSDPSTFAQLSYNAAGQIEEEVLDPIGILSNATATRRYEYDAPGQLTAIRDPFLAQQLSFIEGGYGQNGHGDGVQMHNVMTADWSRIENLEESQTSWFRIPQEEFSDDKVFNMCINALKRVGIVDKDTNIPVKLLTRALLAELPLTCDGSVGYKLQNLIAKYLPPTSNYGHSYGYGNHRELVKAKFFGDEEAAGTTSPLKLTTFMEEIPEVDSFEKAEEIWDKLIGNGYLVVDNGVPEDKTAAIGKQGLRSPFRFSELASDLKGLDPTYEVYAEPILKLIYKHVVSGDALPPLGDFQDTYVNWHGYMDTPTATIIINMARQAAAKIYAMLEEKSYLSGDLDKLLDPEYVTLLSDYEPILGKITKLMTDHFSSQIGSNVYDYESYYIDPNGNHGMFYAGLQRHEIEYDGASNQIKRLKVRIPFASPGEDEIITEFSHDHVGNVNSAEHKGVKSIRYHPVTNRPMLMELTDGRRIVIKYDGQGERLLKRVFGQGNRLLSETKYLRDENGQVLMDKVTKYGENREVLQELESTYLYGPRGHILGFIRNGKFYSVFTDHAGSTRLITQGGKVVAGYDYWPYGEMIRSFGEEDAHLMYRFTGQEYDEEVDLYNYHARIYDPTIGRFFQPDPKAQYFSPYVYGGNSPVALVDPDGEFFFWIIVAVCAVVGAYLAGAAANGSWNPMKWDWKSGKTWQAILGGAIGGAMLPGAFAAAAASIGVIPALLVGIGGSYLQMVQQSGGKWNPGEWDWSNPATYNAFLEGFSNGLAKGPDAIKNAKGFLKSFSKVGQKLLMEVAAGTGMALIKGAMANDKNFKFWEWDWTDPETLSAIKDGFFTGKGLPEQATKAYRNFADIAKSGNLSSMLKDMKGTTKKFLKDVFKNPKHPLWKSMGKAVISYVATGKEMGTLDFTKWDWNSQSTYESLLNNYKIGSELKGMMETFRKRDWVLAGVDFFRKEIQQRTNAHPVMEKIFDGVDAVWKFYDLPSMPFKRKEEILQRIMMATPIVMKMLYDLGSEHKMFEDDDQFRKEMQEILGGLRAGSNIFPVLSEELSQLIDCEESQGFRNGSRVASGSFEKCSIGSRDGKISRQNRELAKKLFVPSRVHQSKNEFVPVKLTDTPEEYSETILDMFHGMPENLEGFMESFFLGSIFHSILNTRPISSSSSRKSAFAPTPLYFLNEHIPELDQSLFHVGMVTSKQNATVLTVRTVVPVEADKFQEIKEALTDYLKSKDYHCQLPPNAPEIDQVQGESIVMATSVNGTEIHMLTPDYFVEPCDGEGEKFKEIPVPTGNIFEKFEGFLDDEATAEERTTNYEYFLQELISIHENVKSEFLPHSSFIPFAYGLISGNLKETYEISLEIGKNSSPNKILLVPQRNSKGQSTWHGIPAVVTSQSGNDHLSGMLHKSTLLSISQKALIGTVTDSVTVTQSALPKFTGALEAILEGDSESTIENAIRYLYHEHHVVKSSSSTPSPQSSENSHFVSSFILGEFLSRMESTPWDIYVLAPEGLNEQQRLKSQRLFFLHNPETWQAKILNLVESSVQVGDHFEFDSSVDMGIPFVPDVDFISLQVIQVKLNANSNSGWNLAEAESGDVTKEQGFFQDVEIYQNRDDLQKNSSAFLKLESPTGSLTNGQLSFSKNYITNIFESLKEGRLHHLINQNLDFESVAIGLLMGASLQITPDSDGISMALRKFVTNKDSKSQDSTPTTLSLLSLTKEGIVIPQTEQVLLASLKTVEESGGDEGIVDQKMEVAREELKRYQCTREQRLNEAFKVSSVPAVYDSGEIPASSTGERLRFEVDPESLAEMNCTVPESPFEKYLRKDEETVPPSSGIFDFIKTKFNQYLGGSRQPEVKSLPKDASVDGCHLGAWVNDEGYSTDGITCTTGKSRLAVFRNVQPNDIVTVSGRGKPFNLVGDNYKKGSCTPVSWNGKPSVACEGEKTTLIYTPYLEPRIFDELDGNLMLGRVMLHFGGKLYRFVRHQEWRSQDVGGVVHIVTEEMMMGWEKEVTAIQEELGKWEGPKEEVGWVEKQLEECTQLLTEVREGGLQATPEMIEEITERLGALEEDFSEQILVAKVGGIFDETMVDDMMNGHNGNVRNGNNFYSGVGLASGSGAVGSGFSFNSNAYHLD